MATYAYGEKTDFIYQKPFEDVHFPTDHFDWVTCHDVVEHVLDPVAFIEEMFRVTKQEGQCIIDFPDYHQEEGDHHWKEEHIWYFEEIHLRKLLRKAGFVVTEVRKPILSKLVFYCVKPEQDRPTILLPPGLGDSFWSIIKLQAFLERERLSLPDVYIASPREKKYGGHKRAFPFLEMFPFLNSTGGTKHTKAPGARKIWMEAYAKEGRTVFDNVLGCDHFISYNGHLRVGKKMEDIDPDLETNWEPPMFVSLEQENFKDECARKYGNYIVFYFIFGGTYCHWTKELPVNKLALYIKRICEEANCTPIFTGAIWDGDDQKLNKLKCLVPGHVDLIGRTSVDQLFGLLRSSQMVVGYPSGLSIIAACLKIKTLIIWNDYYDREFAWHCCPDSIKNKTYFIENTKGLTADSLVSTSLAILKGEKPVERDIVKAHSDPRNKPTSQLPPQVLPEAYGEPRPRKLIKEGSEGITIACVLKNSAVYNEKYARNMFSMLQRNITIPFRFVALTDREMKGIECIKLEDNLEGWWSKLELFRLAGPVLYFDLDTVILDDITSLVRNIKHIPYNSIRMLTPFNKARRAKGQWASGIMAFHGDFRFILNEHDPARQTFYRRGGDQAYITDKLNEHGIIPKPLQEICKIYSYRKHCQGGAPEGAEVICFHGRNRPHMITDNWVKETWR